MPFGPANLKDDLLIGGSGGRIALTAFGYPSDNMLRRVCILNGLNQYSTKEKGFSDAIAYVMTIHPFGQGYSAAFPLAIAREWEAEPVMTDNGPDDDHVRVIVTYIYNGIGGDPTIWTLSSRGFNEALETDVEYDENGNPRPIGVDNYIRGWSSFQKPDGSPNYIPIVPVNGSTGGVASGRSGSGGGKYEDPQPIVYGTVVVPKPHKQWILTRRILSSQVAADFDRKSDDYLGRLNSVIYKGTTKAPIIQNLNCSTGTVLCDEAGVDYDIEGNYVAKLVLTYKPEGHQPFVRYTDPETGAAPANLWRAGDDKYGHYGANGVVQTTSIKYADLNVLLTLLDDD